jgi:hypothetical protein
MEDGVLGFGCKGWSLGIWMLGLGWMGCVLVWLDDVLTSGFGVGTQRGRDERCRVSRGIEELWNFGFVGESSRREEKQII